MGGARLKCLKDAENDLRELKVKSWRKKGDMIENNEHLS
jgi:hypothetical protein